MAGRFFLLATWCALLWCLQTDLVRSRDAVAAADGAVWTAIIPDAFPRYVYTWRMSPDGSYREDGRDGARGRPIQATLSGHWSLDGARMTLRQEGYPFASRRTKNLRQGIAGGFGGLALRGYVSARPNGPAMLHRRDFLLP
jgi:hypothetical protein